jgi:hypothetical protein
MSVATPRTMLDGDADDVVEVARQRPGDVHDKSNRSEAGCSGEVTV